MTKNGVTTHYTSNSRGQIVSESGDGQTIGYSYDDEGHLIRKTDSLNGAFDYTWRDGQFLEQVNGPGGAVNYEYDFQGNRIAETLNGQTIGYHVDSSFDYAQVLAEYDAGGAVLASYTVGLERLSMQRNGQTYYYITDGFGSVRYLLDEQGGEVGRYTYDAFGNVIDMQVNVENRFLFRGEFQDAFTGDYYLRARWFTPTNGQFTSMDPHPGDMFFPQTLHKYLYCGGDPVNRVDPSGGFSLLELNVVETIQQGLRSYNQCKKYLTFKNMKNTLYFTYAAISIGRMFLYPEKSAFGIIWKTTDLWRNTQKYPDIQVLIGKSPGGSSDFWSYLARCGVKVRFFPKGIGSYYYGFTIDKDGFGGLLGGMVDCLPKSTILKLLMFFAVSGKHKGPGTDQYQGKFDVTLSFVVSLNSDLLSTVIPDLGDPPGEYHPEFVPENKVVPEMDKGLWVKTPLYSLIDDVLSPLWGAFF